MNKIIINQKENTNYIFVYQDDELVEQYQEEISAQRLEGNIYLGKVKDIVEGMQSAFIDIGQEKKALIHIKDILSKESNITGNVNLDINKYDIKKIIKPNDEMIVQIKKDCSNLKGPRVTKDIKLVGKYIVLMPYSKFIAVSQKIEDNSERKRLVEITKSAQCGAIIRTSAMGQNQEIIDEDIKELKEKWNEINEKAKKLKAPTELYNNNGIIGKLITDFEPMGLDIYTNSKTVKEDIEKIDSKVIVKIDKSIDQEIEKKRKFWLKCGGYITLDTTEALTAIDVNSGSFTGKNQLEDTVLKVNIEATKEAAKQIRLYDIGGIILIDFIDMEKEEDKEKVRNAMLEAFKDDRSKVQVLEFTKLGLLEITRKHILGK